MVLDLGHYIPHAGGPQRSFKPDGVVHQSSAPFQDATMYRTEYTPKEIEPCPAALLEYVSRIFFRFTSFIFLYLCRTPRSNFILHHTEATGHKFYQSQQEAAQNQYQQHPDAV